jgi:hypothetical protein
VPHISRFWRCGKPTTWSAALENPEACRRARASTGSSGIRSGLCLPFLKGNDGNSTTAGPSARPQIPCAPGCDGCSAVFWRSLRLLTPLCRKSSWMERPPGRRRRPYGTHSAKSAAFPTLKRGANDPCAYGAVRGAFRKADSLREGQKERQGQRQERGRGNSGSAVPTHRAISLGCSAPLEIVLDGATAWAPASSLRDSLTYIGRFPHAEARG